MIGKYFKKNPDARKKVFLATKFAIHITKDAPPAVRGDPEYVKQAIDSSLGKLGVEYVDLYYAHR